MPCNALVPQQKCVIASLSTSDIQNHFRACKVSTHIYQCSLYTPISFKLSERSYRTQPAIRRVFQFMGFFPQYPGPIIVDKHGWIINRTFLVAGSSLIDSQLTFFNQPVCGRIHCSLAVEALSFNCKKIIYCNQTTMVGGTRLAANLSGDTSCH